MKAVYKRSRMLVSILAAVVSLIVFLPTGAGCLIAVPAAWLAAYLFCIPCEKLTQKVIALGDRIHNRLLNALYFVGFPVIAALLCYLVTGVFGLASAQIPTSTISEGITVGILFMIPLVLIAAVAAVVSLQTWIVVILRLFQNPDEEPNPKRSNEQ